LLLQAKLANSYPETTSEKLIFQYSTLNIGQTSNPAASTTTTTTTTAIAIATATTAAKSKPNRDAVSSKPQTQAQPDQLPSSVEFQQQDNSHHTTTSIIVAGSTVSTNTTIGVKRKKKSETTVSNTKQPKVSHPDTSQLYPFETHPLVSRTSQSGISHTANANLYTSITTVGSFIEATGEALPSNHAFSTSFHSMHSNNTTSRSTISAPVVNNSNTTSLTMGIMASIPTMAEYEISSNNGSNDG